jgi:hypothetical protein
MAGVPGKAYSFYGVVLASTIVDVLIDLSGTPRAEGPSQLWWIILQASQKPYIYGIRRRKDHSSLPPCNGATSA